MMTIVLLSLGAIGVIALVLIGLQESRDRRDPLKTIGSWDSFGGVTYRNKTTEEIAEEYEQLTGEECTWLREVKK